MRQYWDNLQPRERRILAVGAVALLLLLLYALVWDPYRSAVARLEQSVAEQRELVIWMQGAAAEVNRLQKSSGRKQLPPGQSLLTVVDSMAKAQGLGQAIKRVQPDGARAVRVWMEQASFDSVLKWIDTLNARYGIVVTGLVVDRQETPGLVNARVVVEG